MKTITNLALPGMLKKGSLTPLAKLFILQKNLYNDKYR